MTRNSSRPQRSARPVIPRLRGIWAGALVVLAAVLSTPRAFALSSRAREGSGRWAVVLLAAIASILLPARPPAQAAEPTPASLTARLADLVGRYERLGRFSGAVLVGRGDVVLYAGAAGEAVREHGVPNRVDTRFQLASLSKQFAAAAVLKLEAQGKLSVDDPIVAHLPDYPRPQGEKVTLHHLLTHTSGIPSLGRRGDGLEDVTDTGDPISLADLIALSSSRELLLEPGSSYRYSNSAYAVAAAVVEAVSGVPFGDFLRRELFEPAGMRDTGLWVAEEVVPGLAEGYFGFPGELRRPDFEHSSWGIGAGGVYSTVGDLFRWHRALHPVLGDDRVLPAAQRAKLTRPYIARSQAPGAGHYGYGWFLDTLFGRPLVSHGGTTEGWVCDFYRFLDEDVAVIVLSNHLPRLGIHVPGEIADRAAGMVLGEEVPELPPSPAAAPVADPGRFTGTYRFASGHTLEVEAGEGGLWLAAAGPEPFSPFTYAELAALNREAPEVEGAVRFVELLAAGRFEEVLGLLKPDWAARSTPEDFREPWNRWAEEHGELRGWAPFELVREKEVDVARFTLRYARRDVRLEVVLDREGRVVGWWEDAEVPQGRAALHPEEGGGFYLDGFRFRDEGDPRVSFITDADGRVTGLVLLDGEISYEASRLTGGRRAPATTSATDGG